MPSYDNINGVLRKTSKIYDNVGGVLREVKNGYDNINGVLRKYHSASIPISNLSIGSLVRVPNTNGTYCVYKVVATNRYGQSNVVLMMVAVINYMVWTSTTYNDTNINTLLNGTIYTAIKSSVKNKIQQISYPFSDQYGSYTYSVLAYITIPSITETGAKTVANDGSVFSIFTSDADRIAYNLEGVASAWFCRSSGFATIYYMYLILSNGHQSSDNANKMQAYLRPLMCIDPSTECNPTPNADGSFDLL